MDIKPNPSCTNPTCRKQQAAYLKRYNSVTEIAARQAAAAKQRAPEAPIHEENDWKIEVLPEDDLHDAQSEPQLAKAGRTPQILPQGLQYELPVQTSVLQSTAKHIAFHNVLDLQCFSLRESANTIQRMK